MSGARWCGPRAPRASTRRSDSSSRKLRESASARAPRMRTRPARVRRGPAPTLAKRTRRPATRAAAARRRSSHGLPHAPPNSSPGDRRRRTRARPPGGATSPTRRSPGALRPSCGRPSTLLRWPRRGPTRAGTRATVARIGPAARRRPAPPRPAWARSCHRGRAGPPAPRAGERCPRGPTTARRPPPPAPAWRGRPPRGWPRRPGCEGRSCRTRRSSGAVRVGDGGGALGACSRKSRAPARGEAPHRPSAAYPHG